MKRMLAYSSIAQAGFIMIGLISGTGRVPAWCFTFGLPVHELGRVYLRNSVLLRTGTDQLVVLRSVSERPTPDAVP